MNFPSNYKIVYLLGFSCQRLLKNRTLHKSDLSVNIIKLRSIHVGSKISSEVFYNDSPSHKFYEFATNVDPGIATNETLTHLIYLRVINRKGIHNLSLQVLDQDSGGVRLVICGGSYKKPNIPELPP